MRNLNQFTEFNMEKFISGKVLQYVDQTDWVDRDTGKLLGTRVDVVIVEDLTHYAPSPDGAPRRTNRFEKMTVKVPGPVSVAQDATVELVNPKAKVWGDYKNQLSVEAEGVRAVAPQPSSKPPLKPSLGKE